MPRPRTIADEVLLDAALEIIHRSGPSRLSFATLAERVGLAASTLVQRFGTKEALLRGALLRAWDRLDADTTAAIEAASPDGAGVIDLLVALSGQYDAHDYAEQLLVLREDLRDSVLRTRGATWIDTLAAAIESRLVDAPGGPDGLGVQVVAQWQGTLTVWSFTRPGRVDVVVRHALEDLLARLVDSPNRSLIARNELACRRARPLDPGA